MNQVFLVGNLGDAPVTLPSKADENRSVTSVSLATNKRVKNTKGEWEYNTMWHRVVFFGKRGEYVASKAQRGSKLTVIGKIRYSTYEKDGIVRSSTDIIADSVMIH